MGNGQKQPSATEIPDGFDPRVRFNWGYHEGARDRDAQRMERTQFDDGFYGKGYGYGYEDVYQGRYEGDSSNAWVDYEAELADLGTVPPTG